MNGSLHTLEIDGDRAEPFTLFRRRPADKVITDYLAEVPRMSPKAPTTICRKVEV